LIVDDDRDIRESLTDVLVDEGYDVRVASHGLQALDRLRAEGELPGLILLDWMMPVCDGREFRRRQKAEAAIADVPVALLTADSRLESKTTEIDAVDYLHKPIELDRLLELIRRYCG
jgi:DNA-binding response OmpR family regulator